jgi:hypothetical protein
MLPLLWLSHALARDPERSVFALAVILSAAKDPEELN